MLDIVTGRRDLAFAVTKRVYGSATNYVPPLWSDFDRMLDPARNPLVTRGQGRLELFVALRDGAPVGRIVACMHDASNARHGTARIEIAMRMKTFFGGKAN